MDSERREYGTLLESSDRNEPYTFGMMMVDSPPPQQSQAGIVAEAPPIQPPLISEDDEMERRSLPSAQQSFARPAVSPVAPGVGIAMPLTSSMFSQSVSAWNDINPSQVIYSPMQPVPAHSPVPLHPPSVSPVPGTPQQHGFSQPVAQQAPVSEQTNAASQAHQNVSGKKHQNDDDDDKMEDGPKQPIPKKRREDKSSEPTLIPLWAAPKAVRGKVPKKSAQQMLVESVLKKLFSFFVVSGKLVSSMVPQQPTITLYKATAPLYTGQIPQAKKDITKNMLFLKPESALAKLGQAAASGLWGSLGKKLRACLSHHWSTQHTACEGIARALALSLPRLMHERTSNDYVNTLTVLTRHRASITFPVAPAVDQSNVNGVLQRVNLGFVCVGDVLRVFTIGPDRVTYSVRVPGQSPIRAVCDIILRTRDKSDPLSVPEVRLIVVATEKTMCAFHVSVSKTEIVLALATSRVDITGLNVTSMVSTVLGSVVVSCHTKSSLYEAVVTRRGVTAVRPVTSVSTKPLLGRVADTITGMFIENEGIDRLYIDESRKRLYAVPSSGDTVAVFAYNDLSTGIVSTPVAVLEGLAERVRREFPDARLRTKDFVPADIDKIFAHFTTNHRQVFNNSQLTISRASRSPVNKWDFVVKNAGHLYCPPLVASVVVLPASESPFASIVVVLSSGHRIYYDTEYTMGQVRDVPPTISVGVDTVFDAIGATGCIAMLHKKYEESRVSEGRNEACTLLSRSYLGSSSGIFAEEFERVDPAHFGNTINGISFFTKKSAIALCTPKSTAKKTKTAVKPKPSPTGQKTGVTRPTDIMSTSFIDPQLFLCVFSDNGTHIDCLEKVRHAQALLTMASSSSPETLFTTFFDSFPPTIAAAVAFSAYLEINDTNIANSSSNNFGGRRDVGDVVRENVWNNARLGQKLPVCDQFGKFRCAIEGQSFVVDRVLAPILAMRTFDSFFDKSRNVKIAQPTHTADQNRILREKLERLEQSLLHYNDFGVRVNSANFGNMAEQERLLRQFQVIRQKIDTLMVIDENSEEFQGRQLSVVDEIVLVHAHALLCRRIGQILKLLSILIPDKTPAVAKEEEDSVFGALYLLPEVDIVWLGSASLFDLTLTEQGNAAIARIINVIRDYQRAHRVSDATIRIVRDELSLFHTPDSAHVFTAKELLCDADVLPKQAKITRDQKINEAVMKLRMCGALEFNDLEACVSVMKGFGYDKKAVAIVRDCAKRSDPNNYALVYHKAQSQAKDGKNGNSSNAQKKQGSSDDDAWMENEVGKHEFEYREKCYDLMVRLISSISEPVRHDYIISAESEPLLPAEEKFRDIIVETTSGPEDELWLEKLLMWLVSNEFTRFAQQIEVPYVERFLSNHPRRDVLLPGYYITHGRMFEGAMAFLDAATKPTMQCTLEQREGSLLLAQRMIKDCSVLKPEVATLSAKIATATEALRFQQHVRAAVCFKGTVLPSEEHIRVCSELENNLFSVDTLVDAYVKPLALTELELEATALQMDLADRVATAKALWIRVLKETKSLDEASKVVSRLRAKLPNELFPLDVIIPALEEKHILPIISELQTISSSGSANTSANDAYNIHTRIMMLPCPVDTLVQARVPYASIFFEYQTMCSEPVHNTAPNIVTSTKRCACVKSMLHAVTLWLQSLGDVFATPRVAEDAVVATSVLQLTHNNVSSSILSLEKMLTAEANSNTADRKISAAFHDAVLACRLVRERLEKLKTSKARRIALSYEQIPQASWILNQFNFSRFSATSSSSFF